MTREFNVKCYDGVNRLMTYHEYIQCPEWKAKRADVLERDGFKCQQCSSTYMHNVHHKTYARLGNESLDDLITLCQVCHRKEHGL